MNKYIFSLCCIIITTLSIFAISVVDSHYCKSISFYRLFTIDSTVCHHITLSQKLLEKTFSSLLISLGCHLVNDISACSTHFKNTYEKHDYRFYSCSMTKKKNKHID